MNIMRILLSNLALKIYLKLSKGDTNMVYIYCSLIINNRRTFEQVPVNLQPAVEEELAIMGLGTDGKPLPVEEPTA
jgi:hypothetical protein